jgi:hypothetical protein
MASTPLRPFMPRRYRLSDTSVAPRRKSYRADGARAPKRRGLRAICVLAPEIGVTKPSKPELVGKLNRERLLASQICRPPAQRCSVSPPADAYDE